MLKIKQKAQGPHRSSESYWLNISHINACKVTFLYCGPNYEKSVPFANKMYQSPNFAVNRRIIWISNKIYLDGANEYSNFWNEKICVKIILRLKFLKVEIFRKTIYCENVFEKKLKEIETKMPKFRNISISRIPTTPDWNYKQVVITCIIIRYLYSLNIKLFTKEVDL
jgi:hypothetical protein